MEEQCTDPYEQQLFAVFESCLVEGQTDLKEEGLQSLCEKLQLDDTGKDMILSLLNKDQPKNAISFRDFRDGLLELLDKSQEKPSADPDHQIIEEDSYIAKINDKITTMKYQLGEYINDRIFDAHKIDEFWNDDHSTNNAVNGSNQFPVYRYSKVTAMAEQENCHGKSQDVIKMDGKLNIVKCGSQFASCMQNNSIVDMWEMAGIQDASTLLSDLGFEMSHVNTGDLINVLLDELKSHHDEPHDKIVATHIKLLKCTLCLFQEQNRHLSNLMEHLSFERDKLRTDVLEANERANSLAQEIDEHHTRMEKCRQEQLKQLESKHAEITKELMNQLNSDREKSSSAIQKLDRHLQNSQQEEQRIKNELANMMRETRELEAENQMLSNEISKLKSFNDQLSVQVERLAAQHDDGKYSETDENEQITDLLNHVKHLKSEIATLRDHNDELTVELEYYKRIESDTAQKSNSASSLQKAFSNDNDEDSSSLSNHTDSGTKLELASDRKTNLTEIQSNHEMKLQGIRTAILETVHQLWNLSKQQPCSENCTLRLELSTILANFESQLPLLKEHDQDAQNGTQKVDKIRLVGNPLSIEDSKNMQKNKSSGLRDYPPRKEDPNQSTSKSDITKSLLQLVSEKGKETDNPSERQVDLKSVEEFLRDREAKLVNEKKQVLERCAELEQSLELLKMEYEQCEDYWTVKLEEERELFEQEQKISDEKFKELINQMTEFEEQFNSGDKSRGEGRLTPIEEKVNLEQQYADLEEEFDKWKLQSQEELDEKEKQISELKTELESKPEKSDVSIQFPEEGQDSSTPFSYHSLDSAATFDVTSARDSVDADAKVSEPEEPRKKGTRKRRSRQSASSADFSDQMETDISFDDVRWLIKKKTDIGFECKALQKQREKLRQEVAELQSIKEMNDYRVMNSLVVPPVVDIGTMQALYLRIQAQEQRQKDLLACIRHQQQDTMRLLHQTWKQHHNEITDLKVIIHNSREQLEQQCLVNREQGERLTRADQLTKELYLENTQLLESIKRLEEHCHILSQCNTECTSV